MKNKFTIIMLIISILASMIIIPVGAEKETDENIAYAVLGENLKTKNFTSFKVGAQADNKQVSERNGEECWIIDKANGLQSDKLCMILDDDFKKGVDNGDAYIVEVDYFDVAKGGFFFVAYDSQRPRQEGEYWSMAEEKTVYTEGTDKWKTATFRIDDGKFEKSLEGSCDLFVGTRLSDALNNPNYLSEIPIPFKEVRIRKIPGANPVRTTISIDNVGNAFAWYDENKIIHNRFTNLRDEALNYDITFELENADGYVAYSKTEKISFEAGEEKNFDLNFGEFKRCDRYNYFVTVENKDLGIKSRVQYSVVAIIKSDENGILNEHMNFCGPGYSQQSLTTEENFGMALDLMKLGGFSGSRYDEGWHNRETVPGNFNANTKQDTFIAKTAERNLNILPILYFGNNVVTGGWNRFPDTDEEFLQAEKYAEKVIPHLAQKTDTYEAWNEPDLYGFAQNFTPEGYMRLYSMVADKIKKYDPKAKMGYLCYAGAGGQIAKDYTTEMLEMGLAEMIRGNAITFHGYPNPNAETFNTSGKIQWYVDELKKHGVSRDEYEVWITEFGGTVADSHIATKKRQGAVTVRETLLQRIEQDVDRFYVYRFEDPGNLTYRREASFGHVSSSNGYARIYGQICVPWESFVMLSAYNYLFADSEPESKVVFEDNLRAYKFKSNKFGKDIISLNSVSGVEILTLDLGVNTIKYFDEYGNEMTLSSDDGIYTFSATEYPHYIMGDFEKTEVLEGQDRFEFSGSVEGVANDFSEIKINNNTGEELKFELEAAKESITTAEKTLKCGENTIKFKNNAEVGKEYEIRIVVKGSDDSVISVLPVQVKSVPIALTQMSIQLKSPGNFNKWQGIARISNSSDTKVLKGKFEVTAPEKFKTKKPIDIAFVPRSKTAEISFELPEITQKQIYTFEYKLTLDTGEVIEGEAKADTTCAAFAEEKPVIDGKMDEGEWNVQTLMQTSKLDNVVYSQGWQGKPWQGADDQSAKAYAMWDEEKVYFCWDVTDDVFSQDYEEFYTWQGDSVQIGVYMGANDEYIALGEANTTFTEIGIAKTLKGDQVYRFSAQDSSKHKTGLLSADECELAINVEGNRAVYELAMDWDSLLPDGITPKANSRLGFSFLVNDNDGAGRRGAILFAGGIFFNKDSSQFTYINLIGK